MNYAINIIQLKQNLAVRPDESERFINLSSRLKEENKGVLYLFDNVVLPIIQGKSVSSSDLDMECFNFEDIEDVIMFYEKNFSNNSKEVKMLHNLFQICCTSAPEHCPIDFL